MLIENQVALSECRAKLLLIGGAPGSGKTSLARTLDRELVEADQFFELGGGGYAYDSTKIKEAHAWAQNKVRVLLLQGQPVVATAIFARHWERMAYANIAHQIKCGVAMHFCSGEFPNVHGVSQDKVESIRLRIEPFRSLNPTRRRPLRR